MRKRKLYRLILQAYRRGYRQGYIDMSVRVDRKYEPRLQKIEESLKNLQSKVASQPSEFAQNFKASDYIM